MEYAYRNIPFPSYFFLQIRYQEFKGDLREKHFLWTFTCEIPEVASRHAYRNIPLIVTGIQMLHGARECRRHLNTAE